MSKLIGRSRWLQRYNQGIIALSLPFVIFLSIIPLFVGAQPFLLSYIFGVRLLSNVAVICVCFCLQGYQNKVIRRLMILLLLVGIINVIGVTWFLIEVFFLSSSIGFPSGTTSFELLALIVLVIGLAVITGEQRGRRSLTSIVGYIALVILFLGFLLHVYNANLLGVPLVPFALIAGARMLLGWFAIVFAWSFFFAKNTPYELIDHLCRATLVITVSIQFLAYTHFAFQYGFLHSMVPVFYLAGSVSDSLLLLSNLMFLVTALAIFAQTIENMPEHRPASVRYTAVATILIISLLMGILLILIITAVSLIQGVLLIFLPLGDAAIAMQIIGIGFFSLVGILLVFGGAVSFFLFGLMFRPLEKLEEQVLDVSEPGITAYEEPRHLLFTELQSLSDNYRLLIERMKRIRFELNKAKQARRVRRSSKPGVISERDQYDELLVSQVMERSQEIQGNAEALTEMLKDDPRASEYVLGVTKEAKWIQRLISSVLKIRQIGSNQAPELSRVDMCRILSKVTEEVKEHFNQRELTIPSKLPRSGCYVLANLLLHDLFTNLLHYMIEKNPHNKVTIEVAAKEITWAAVTYWQVTFSDEGNVIPDEEKDLLFRRDLRPAKDSPLTLLLVEKIAASFKGKVEVSNRIPGDRRYGTVFILRIPSVKLG